MKKIFALYSTLLIITSFFSYYFVDPNFPNIFKIYEILPLSSKTATLVYVTLVLMLFSFYLFILKQLKDNKINVKEIFILIFLSVFILTFSHPTLLSYDIFNYIATAKVTYFYQENPYIIMPIEFSQDPILGFTHAANKIALYGPFWILLTIVPFVISFGNYLTTLFAFKIFITFFYLATLILIWKYFKNSQALVLFGLNPLVVIETLISGHNDIVMVFLVLCSYVLILQKKIIIGILFFIFSILIKYATLFLVPVVLYLIYKQKKKEKINLNNLFYFSSLSMFLIFLLSPLREEIYPWYAIWFLIFASLSFSKRIIYVIFFSFSFSLMFRYVPFMFVSNYLPPVPLLKTIITFSIPTAVLLFWLIKNKLWQKIYSQ